jgi:hypothetical protein
MFSPLIRFLFPKACLYCREIHSGKGLLCEICVVGLDLIYPKRRCETCFRESIYRKCEICIKTPSPWYKAGSVFLEGDAGSLLLSDPDRFGKEIAAFFIIQYVRLKWPLPDAFYTEKSLKPVSDYFPKFLPLKKTRKRKEYAAQKILFLVSHFEKAEIPEFLLGARIYLLSYLY